ncbi:CPBP family intramembrane glutamic endopeptidase [Clostridium sp. MB40-C1]|uniref:CPBP family intramembrane glutamic endopeptidase n=1 Tax=Clostridium sp. MB40-C1 TaxID=3070996 RepID=UPI0027DF49AD|nr:CPBP family intramembrane glutamic endopeptidase [Clostridium sp. MB40-C1]WMJ80870.1 CPBP family intramembrane glutamic endopeptidase [Clostridium sp. MB40-C1]
MKKFLYLVLYILEYIVIYFLVQTVVNVFIIWSMRKDVGIQNIDKMVSNCSFKVLPLVILMTFGIYYLLFKLKGENLIKYCDFNNKLKKKYIMSIVLLTIGFSLVVASMAELGGDIYNIRKDSFLELIALLIFIPVFEEILFRGIIFNKFRENIDLFSAVIIQAVIFGGFHGAIFQIVYTSILGIITALIYTWSDSIWAAILTHGIFNICGLIILPSALNISKNIMRFSVPIYGVAGALILLFSFRKFYRITRPRKPFNSFFTEL